MNNSQFDHGLSDSELQEIKRIFSLCKFDIDRVGIFGSRAMGSYKDNSDIDFVVYGDLSEKQISRIYTLFDESNLGLKVDVKGYQTIEYAPLKRHIDQASKTLFTREDLNEASI